MRACIIISVLAVLTPTVLLANDRALVCAHCVPSCLALR